MAVFTGDVFPGVALIALQHNGQRLMWSMDNGSAGLPVHSHTIGRLSQLSGCVIRNQRL